MISFCIYIGVFEGQYLNGIVLLLGGKKLRANAQKDVYICVHIHIHGMGTKTISIMDDIYDKLKALKLPDESFSDELRRLTEKKGNIMDLAGAWSDLSKERADKMKKAIDSMRDGTRMAEILKKQER